MNISIHQPPPTAYAAMVCFTADAGFTMASDTATCMLLRTLAASKPGGRFRSRGVYILDDMLPQPNWPEGHQEKAIRLIAALEARTDLFFTSQEWATGIIMGVKK